MPSIGHRGTRLPDPATEDRSPVPTKRAKLSHNQDQHKAVKSLLDVGTFTAHSLDHSRSRQQAQVNDSRAVVTNGMRNGDVDTATPVQFDHIEISSDSEEDDDDDDGDVDEAEQHRRRDKRGSQHALTNGSTRAAAKSTSVARSGPQQKSQIDEEEDDDEDGAPTFGELAARDEAVEVEDGEQTALAPAPNQSLTAPNALTLTSVLTQALRSNDSPMLESCLLLNDLESIRKTIERLPSPLIATLLKKLSERLHRRPGRAGNLLIWVQWSLVAHGGYLATQPDVVRKLQELSRVIKERAAALQPLMGLKGRLDMLAAQVELRRSAQAEHQASGRSGEEDAVIYVEGEESSSSDDDDEEDVLPGESLAKRISAHGDLDVGAAESTDDETMLVNGIGASEDDVDEDEDEEDVDENAQFIDDEALGSDDDEDEEDDLSVDDEDDEVDGASDEEDDHRPATRRSTALRGSGFSRR